MDRAFPSSFARKFSPTLLALACLGLLAVPAFAQPLIKNAVQVDAGNTKETGQTFGYRLTYSCNSTVGPCNNARVIDLLPAEVEFVSTVPAAAAGDVASVNVTSNFMGTGRTQVEFVMVDPLTAGNSGDLVINVRFPNGVTPDVTVASNVAEGINLESTPGTFPTSPPIDVTAVASLQVELTKSTTTATNLDLPVSYRLRVRVPNSDGALNISGLSFTDTLPVGDLIAQPPLFQGATPAADCEPGCVGTRPATLTWSGPFTVNFNQNRDINLTVIYDSATFSDGSMVTNTFTADGTPVGEAAQNLGTDDVTHPVTTFTPNPSSNFDKSLSSGPNPPTLLQPFNYQMNPRNNGNVPLDTLEMIDSVPIQTEVLEVRTGSYNDLNDFAVGVGVQVSYEKNTAPGTFTAWGSSPDTGTNTTLTAPPPGLLPGEFITRIRWQYGQAQPGMAPTSTNNRPRLRVQVIDPDNAGATVSFGDTISNCADLDAVYDPGGANTPVSQNDCANFVLAGPFTQHSPDKRNVSSFGGPYGVGNTVSYELRADNVSSASDPVPLENFVIADLLPEDLIYTPGSWTFNPNGTGLPAPMFEEIPNYANTGRVLLRWTWPAASGDLDPGQEVRIRFDTTVRFGAEFGLLNNTMSTTQNDPTLDQRCSQESVDELDLDDDGDTTDVLCVETLGVNVAPIAQLISQKEVRGLCDSGFTSTSAGTLAGGTIDYRLSVTNAGSIPMEDFVIVDILPFVGDTGVLDTSARDSLWTPILVAPIIPPPGTTLFYSTSGNPCRPEVGGPTTGCDVPNWTTVPPDPISDARSFKVEFGDRVLGPADQLEFEFQLIAPGNLPGAGSEAFNSFAYLGQRSDGFGSLSAEPNKVGITQGSCPAAALGDFVWVDDDRNGIQDDGPTGLNDVFVELFQPGADGIPRTFDDFRIATTVTSDDAGGDPGWYQFPGLAPGSYYVQFHPPATYDVTTQDAGGDDALDSDADPATACSPVVTLGPTEINPTLDLGLTPPLPAALGNYVWFDRNADGLQNESQFDGANGVAVKLFVDDGDGIAEPGGDDGTPVATTVTADDIYGQPGYYLFDGLAPGVPYFVQFMLPASASGFTGQDSGGDDAIDSDANTTDGTSQVVTLASGEFNPTIDAGLVVPVGDLVLGDQVWCDDDNDGLYEPQDGELGVDGVTLSLYLDANADGIPTIDEYVGSTTTATVADNAGRYRFEELGAGDYIVVVDLENFAGGGPLAGKVSSTGNDPAPDPDDDFNGDDNGTNAGAVIASAPVTLVDNNEPTTDDGDDDTNLTVDFGFAVTPSPEFDYGDAPDVVAGSAAADYMTTALDVGPFHLQGVANMPFLGDCVDADNGTAQDLGASQDDNGSFGLITGTCAIPGDDEDGVTLMNPLIPGMATTIGVRASAGTNDCVLNAWIDWDQNGIFGDSAGEQIATDLTITSGTTSNLTPTVPAGAAPGTTYARFRCSTASGLGPADTAPDGEVEDYLVGILGTDFGDAPDTFSTLLASNGPRHDIDPTNALLLGSCVDTEATGQPNATATGDDTMAGTSRVGLCADDEDGVTFNGVTTSNMVIACQTNQLTVITNGPGLLNAWMNFDAIADFTGLGEQIFTDTALTTGVNVLNFGVPCDAVVGTTYARFRLDSTGGLGPDGPAADGEVEDYLVNLKGNDWGDAPSPFPTALADDGARHGVDTVTPLFLGACVDTELDGQPTGMADGDDVNVGTGTAGTCSGNDDEDGIVFTTMVIACNSASLQVTANAPGVLDAWIDFGRDTGWSEANDRIATGVALTAGSQTLNFNVPCDAAPGLANARFRFSSTGVASFDGAAMDGEVEDYQILVKASDFGDAPDTYGTTIAASGPSHGVDTTSSLYLGACVDTEVDGQANLAIGDDTGAGSSAAGTCAGNDDEDGVTFDTMLIACQQASLTITAGAVGLLDAWVDFDGDGTFTQANNQIFDDRALAAGANGSLTFDVPCTAIAGDTYTRFRFSSTGVATSGGVAMDGEVEDYAVTIKAVDFGDAPDSYSTVFTSGGPNHGVDPTSSLFLGACVDTEVDAATPLDATGDDVTVGATTTGTCSGNDDEDGVTFNTMLIACQTLDLSVTAGAAGQLDAWIDFDGDGTFTQMGEQVFTGQALAAGSNNLSVNVPCAATAGTTYARFRLSSTGGLSYSGAAMDGEVEDYELTAKGVDFGDAPDTYETTFANGGPNHGVDPGNPLYLGACVDTEADAGMPLDASGDDLTVGPVVGSCSDSDEDGVTFDTSVIACQSASLTFTANAPGILDAWIDFGGDGSFVETEDQIFAGEALTTGANTLVIDVPCSAVDGTTYARFRFSSTGIATSGGPAMDGEVEDYAISLREVDFGDAPDTYGTSLGQDGPNHGIVPGFTLGGTIDSEADGNPSPNADGDGSDEDGVTFAGGMAMATACTSSDLSVTLTNTAAVGTAILDAWLDFDGDGSFDDPRDRIASGLALVAGTNTVNYSVPCDVVSSQSYARFRLSSTGVSTPTGPAEDGEVEDYAFVLKGVDYGDAPEPTYPTLLASDGARHTVLPTDNPTLGTLVDTETDGQPSATHNGDDTNGVDDEDGVTFDAVLIPGIDGTITIQTGATGGLVSAWIDFDQNGSWLDAGEQVAADQAIGANQTVALTFPVPLGAPEGSACVRVRISTQAGLTPTGPAPDGEIEDHLAPVGREEPSIGLAKEVVDVTNIGDQTFDVTFEMLFENLGNVPLSDVNAVADLATAFDPAQSFEVRSISSPDFTVDPAFDGDTVTSLLIPGNSLDVGSIGRVTLVVRVEPGGISGPYECSTVASGVSPEDVVVTDISEDGSDPDPDNDGDPTDDDTPSVITFPVTILDIPTLDTVGLALLVLLLGVAATRRLRQRA